MTTPPPARILVVDDEPPARHRLRDLLDDCREQFPLVIADEAVNGVEALEIIGRGGIDIVLTDIRMPVMDGVELARHLARLAQPPAVIFSTAYDEYAVRAFELAAVDYLLKPVRAARLADALTKARRLRPQADEKLRRMAPAARSHFSISERGRILLVPVPAVLFLKAEQKYVVARTREREYLLDESLVQLEDEFPDRFLRIHRNCLIARSAVHGVARATTGEDGEAHWVILLDGLTEQLPVSRRQWPTVKENLGL